jgi:uroporphyrinogen III methyltransferase/synthase
VQPLAGTTVVVTRTRAQASSLVTKLRDAGAVVREVPVIAIAEPPDGGVALRDAAGHLDRYAWVVATSPNGADALLGEASLDALRSAQIAVVGPATAERFTQHGIAVALVPDRYVAEGLLERFPDPPTSAGHPPTVLLAQAAAARPVLADGLRARGWQVHSVVAYETVAADVDDDVRDTVVSADLITFTSASTVERYVDAFGADDVPPVVACIGPVTAAAARARGLLVDIEAPVHSIDGLVAAIVAFFDGVPMEGR